MNPIFVCIVISDPWDVGEELRWAPLRGQLVRIEPDQRGGRALIRFGTPVGFRGAVYQWAVIAPRHEGREVMEVVAGTKLEAAITCFADEPAQLVDASDPRSGLRFIGDVEPLA
jgi:hypothetical protein